MYTDSLKSPKTSARIEEPSNVTSMTSPQKLQCKDPVL